MDKPLSTKIGHGLAWFLRIKLDNYRDPTDRANDAVTRGESVFSVSSADTYVEKQPTTFDWLQEITPSGRTVGLYFYNLFPFLHWIGRYNLIWFTGDMIAGITVGAVVVPQSMAYAQLATLPIEYGLYSSFMGVLIYWFFATSKDITIGPVAVLSTITGTVVQGALPLLPAGTNPAAIASALAIIDGAIITFIGLIRFGWIVEIISLPAISAFMTGSALNIAVGQVPTLMGITGFSNRDSTYLVFINVLKHLNGTKLDAAMGLTALTMLYLIRSGCNWGARRMPQHKRTFFFLSTLRTAFVILLYTGISAGVNLWRRSNPAFKILQDVPRGFQHAGVPQVNTSIISAFAGQLPAVVIVTLIEHISISKSFGRVNNYTIDPSQEMVAIGVTNLLAPFLGAYPATGSFSRTAIKSKAGVRTPFAGVITAIVVLLAIYALPPVFYYISQASLAAVIIHAVGDLITPPNTVYQFWCVSPLEVIIFFAGVIVTVFTSIENGVYVTISVSMAVFLFRAFKARGRFLGKVKIHSVIGDHLVDGNGHGDHDGKDLGDGYNTLKQTGGTTGNDPDASARNVFLPITHHDGSNPQIEVEKPYPGIFIYRFSEGFNYPNANHYLDFMVHTIFQQTRRTNPNSYPRPGDRPWNDPGPRRGQPVETHMHRPTLKAIVLDFSSVNNVDITSVQLLIDVRNQLDMYAAPEAVDWHFAHINNRWTKRALVSAGFGYPSPRSPDGTFRRWKPVFSVAEIGGSESAAAAAERELRQRSIATKDVESGQTPERVSSNEDAITGKGVYGQDWDKGLAESKAYDQRGGGVTSTAKQIAVVQGLNRPLFHVDLTSALQSAITNVEEREQSAPKTL